MGGLEDASPRVLHRATVIDAETGAELDFGHDEGRTPHLYRVALFVTDKKIFVIEAGGAKAEMERQAPQIDWAIKGFLPK